MTQREIYVFWICMVVMALFVGVFSYLVTSLVKSRLKIIHAGLDDQRILTEYEKQKQKNPKVELVYKIFSIIMACVFCVIFAFAIYVNVTEAGYANGIPSVKVVKSSSMSYKNSKNTYLKKYNLNDQFDMFDLIITRKLPDEFELELYDVVVYQHENGEMVIHRIIEIEEPNEKHPTKRYFKLQGDAVQFADTYPVTYEQMRGIYLGERVPFAGSFIMFLQSPAGYFCILLVIIGIALIPIVEKLFEKAEKKRLELVMNKPQVADGDGYNAQMFGFLLDIIKDKIAQGDKPNKPVAKLIVDDKTYSLFASKKQILPEEDNASDIKPQDTNHPLQIIVKDKVAENQTARNKATEKTQANDAKVD